MERGLSNRLTRVWQHRRPSCPESHSAKPTPVAIQEFSPALLMLATGSAIAIFVMLIENLTRKYWQDNNLNFNTSTIVSKLFTTAS